MKALIVRGLISKSDVRHQVKDCSLLHLVPMWGTNLFSLFAKRGVADGCIEGAELAFESARVEDAFRPRAISSLAIVHPTLASQKKRSQLLGK